MFGRKERYQRPHLYSLAVGLTAICCAPNRQRTPVLSLMIQADLNNAGIVVVGDSNVTLLNGLQLDPGRAVQFSTFDIPFSGTLGPSISPAEMVEQARYRAEGFKPGEAELYLDIADFYAIADGAGQIIRLLWSTIGR
jgi:hypothetical protein